MKDEQEFLRQSRGGGSQHVQKSGVRIEHVY